MATVAFDPIGFAQRYPEFAGVSATLLPLFFAEAGLYCNNTEASIVTDIPTRTALLWMLTAHIAALNAGVNGSLPTDLVGRITSVKEGSVSINTDMGPTAGGAAWFNQTKYGAAYWQASIKYRSMRYLPRARG